MARAGPLLDELRHWLDELLTQGSAKSWLNEAIGHTHKR